MFNVAYGQCDMEIDVKLGEKTYTFFSHEDVAHARDLFEVCSHNSEKFETALEKSNIDFFYADIPSSC